MKIKICCIASVEEAELAIANGAWAIGLVGKMPSGPGPIEDSLIAKIAEHVRGRVETFLLTSEQSAQGIVEHAKRTRTTTIQIVDRIAVGSYEDIRWALPEVKLVQVIHVEDEASIEEALEAARHVDYLLLDSGRPNLKVKELGGTGRVHDWEISRKIRERSRVPVFLAGGLNPDNVAEAVRVVQPFGVDICSGVRTDGKLDGEKVGRFCGGKREVKIMIRKIVSCVRKSGKWLRALTIDQWLMILLVLVNSGFILEARNSRINSEYQTKLVKQQLMVASAPLIGIYPRPKPDGISSWTIKNNLDRPARNVSLVLFETGSGLVDTLMLSDGSWDTYGRGDSTSVFYFEKILPDEIVERLTTRYGRREELRSLDSLLTIAKNDYGAVIYEDVSGTMYFFRRFYKTMGSNPILMNSQFLVLE